MQACATAEDTNDDKAMDKEAQTKQEEKGQQEAIESDPASKDCFFPFFPKEKLLL